VGFSIATILVYQGGLALSASAVADAFTAEIVAAMTAAGGVMIIGLGLRLLDLKPVRVASFLPALVVAPVSVALFAR
jgi:uncharacterized membrane protein YqgA involved in biofilm formation